MPKPTPPEFQDRPELTDARRVAFVLGRTEHALGIRDTKELPLSARIENALQGAMQTPELVDENTFELLHILAGAIPPILTIRLMYERRARESNHSWGRECSSGALPRSY